MVLTSVWYRLRAAPAASDKTASFPARVWYGPVQETAWILMGMPLPAGRGTKHSCATTAEVKILHWGTAQLEMPTPADNRPRSDDLHAIDALYILTVTADET